MSKNIILCLDGTWNKPDEDAHAENEETNVRNLWEILDKTQPKRQVVYYDEGVGSQWYNSIIGGISGWGLAQNIREAYFELCQHYQRGDKIFIFGFSRGAYTARSLAGMIYSCGLLNKDQLTDKSVEHAFDIYKNADKRERASFKENNTTCQIEVIGVWDTVGALGIPLGFLKQITNQYLQFHDTKLNKDVLHAYHAVAIDEQREAFKPTLWATTSSTDEQLRTEEIVQEITQKIEQVWFSGVHADIGGGYKARHHSNVAFNWMIAKIKHKVALDIRHYPYPEDVSKKIHDSYKFYYGGKARRLASVTDINTPSVHVSVLKKLTLIDDYTPLALVDLHRRVGLAPYKVVT
ncbi:DUF2235 domain-containing protein [Moritella sp. Urea-trap-13]|uniref:DUF2235 domain-containing protein n=1 Tax=Moritella sp. Urea-trap-13 TaxID=2058327 RepID=UPI000C327045|nr:DUF2235 domain-containing protein [Moritella sp. Urea-trap-13]PKH04782.1 hypothetical protein CXF93_21455 [Moritella sp. Urea-trap-13]